MSTVSVDYHVLEQLRRDAADFRNLKDRLEREDRDLAWTDRNVGLQANRYCFETADGLKSFTPVHLPPRTYVIKRLIMTHPPTTNDLSQDTRPLPEREYSFAGYAGSPGHRVAIFKESLPD